MKSRPSFRDILNIQAQKQKVQSKSKSKHNRISSSSNFNPVSPFKSVNIDNQIQSMSTNTQFTKEKADDSKKHCQKQNMVVNNGVIRDQLVYKYKQVDKLQQKIKKLQQLSIRIKNKQKGKCTNKQNHRQNSHSNTESSEKLHKFTGFIQQYLNQFKSQTAQIASGYYNKLQNVQDMEKNLNKNYNCFQNHQISKIRIRPSMPSLENKLLELQSIIKINININT